MESYHMNARLARQKRDARIGRATKWNQTERTAARERGEQTKRETIEILRRIHEVNAANVKSFPLR